MRLSPVLAGLPAYPFVRLQEARAKAEAAGVDVIDLTIGEPREETPAFIRRALADAIEPLAPYPAAAGLPELREAAARWLRRRFGVTVDPDRHVVPTLGAKEAIYHLPQVLGPGAVAFPTPGYPVWERGALFDGRETIAVPLDPQAGWCMDLDAIPFDRCALVWVNHPGNPTAAVAPRAHLEELVARARAAGCLVASDEAYSELWFGAAPPSSALECGLDGVLAVHTLSKRSSMPGYRSGFVAGDAEVVAALRRHRPNVGTAPQVFVQRAAVAAWEDEKHVEAARSRYAAKRAVLLEGALAAGLREAGGDGGMFLWLALPDGDTDDEGWCARVLGDRGLAVAPGSFLGSGGEGHVRLALTPTLERCREAAARLAG